MDLYYWVDRTDGTALPSWLTFDNETLTFYRVAPNQDDVLEASNGIQVSLSSSLQFSQEPSLSTEFKLQISNSSINLYRPFPILQSTARNFLSASFASSIPGTIQILHHSHDTNTSSAMHISMDVDTSSEVWLSWDRYVHPLLPFSVVPKQTNMHSQALLSLRPSA